MSTSGKGTSTFRGMGHPGSVAVPETPLLDGTVTPSSSKDAETVSNGSEGRACPHDVLEIIFVQKVGAFVNKPINQVIFLPPQPVRMCEPLG